MNATIKLEKKHFPVLLKELISIVSPLYGGTFIDCTFGQGGYSKKILENKNNSVIAIDRDKDVNPNAEVLKKKFGKRFSFINSTFKQINQIDVANKNIKEAQKIQNFIQTEYYKCEISDDIEGIEISSALKNLYSMLIGGSQGLSNPAASKEIQEKYFLNTAASLIHRSISEMVEIVNSYSGKTESVYGLAGLGDIYVSVSGGRNSQMGKYLGQGYLYKEAKEKFMKNTTVEGAQLAFDIGPKLMAKFDKRKFPLLFSILECICENKKLQIDW